MTSPSPEETVSLLANIHSPEDVRGLNMEELYLLAAEIREKIINTVAVTGGHLAPSLGVVELTLALHYVFNTPQDKLIWDVGHQCYAHKLLTGRRDKFHTIRQHQGLSGFPKRSESEYDVVETGHSSTSISYGLGLAAAQDLQGDSSRVIAVIGDGSMTGGLAFEGLNHAGDLHKNLIVILNDNEMSISANVGALSSFLSRKLSSKTMRRLKDQIEEGLKLCSVGENILSVLRKSEESLKVFFTPGMLFEALKFEYIGPIPGHDLEALLETLESVRDSSHGPVLVHVLTTKGKGYEPAEKHPGDYHGLGPFSIADGKPLSLAGPPSYTSVFGKTLCSLAETDKRVAAITAAMPAGTGLIDFSQRFPERFFDVGIAEQHAITFAAGLALAGMRPVTAIYSSFMQRALDQVIHDVCLPKLPVTFAIDRAGVVGDDGPTHHGVFDISFLRFVPSLTLMAPKDENELQHMLYTALNHDGGPCALRYPRGSGEGIALDDELTLLPIGQGELLREGGDILLLPIGNRVYPALQAAEGLAKLGVEAAVINPRFIRPLDNELISDWAKRCGRVLTVEDNVRKGGFGSAVLELLNELHLLVPTRILGYGNKFVEQASQQLLWKNAGIDTAGIIKAALELMK